MCWMMRSQRVEAGPLYTICLPILPPSLPCLLHYAFCARYQVVHLVTRRASTASFAVRVSVNDSHDSLYVERGEQIFRSSSTIALSHGHYWG
jgi:hypothetical protein